MNQIRISDVTMKQTGQDISLSFKEKIELSKLLDKLGVSVIELEGILADMGKVRAIIKEEISAKKSPRACQVCGKPCDKDDAYCSVCGAEL